ncbi:MAG: hypothetical protein IJ192_05745 [Clostridia bacterium]|nr:hypothetical protein [Clostridia bacterium]MBR2175793.1 hypothetical protein [Clostridia bacterium]
MSKILSALGSLLVAAAAAVSLFGGSSVNVGAASEEITVSVPVEQTIKNVGSASTDEFSYILTAEDTENPLPEGSENGTFPFSLVGSSTLDLTMDYTSAGDYYYRLNVGEERNPKYRTDTRQYRILVSVRDSSDGFISQIIAYNENNEKTSISFLHEPITDVQPAEAERPQSSTPSESLDETPSGGEPLKEYSGENQESASPDPVSNTDPQKSSIVSEGTEQPDSPDAQAPLTGDNAIYIGFAALAAISGGIIFILKAKSKKEI